MKKYGQHCPLARALDVVGERWSLLIVRELSLGPRRYSDLQNGLPGVPTNLLATRLRDLTDAGVITKRTLPPPTAVTVYELAEAGHALRPALKELREWGRRHGATPSETDTARPGWALLNAAARPTTLPEGRTCELRVDAEFFHLTANQSTLSIHAGPATTPDATITMPANTLYQLMSGHTTPTTTPNTTITGDHKLARATLKSLHRALT